MNKNANKPTIMIVDDVATNIQLLAGILNEDYHIKVANSGKRCLQLVHASTDIDLILLDIEMPEMNGYEVSRELKKLPLASNIPIIFVTAKDADSDEELGLELGAVDYITKPIRPAIVKARIKTQIMLKRQKDQLIQMALHDQLTNLYNRHYLMETANLKIARSLRHKIPLSVAVLDVDHFKKVNDNHGHEVGDIVLKEIATLLKQNTRKEDIVARLGGEEFVIFFDHCDLNNATKLANYLREKIENLKPAGLIVTSSIGVTTLKLTGESLDSVLKRGDSALYEAKRRARNCVVSQ